MNFYERRIALLQNRISKIRQNPDPRKLKSNLIMYENELDRWEWLSVGWKNGEPFVYACEQLHPLLYALGFRYIESPSNMADRAGAEMADQCLGLIRQEGYPEMGCDRQIMNAVMPRFGDTPTPSLVIAMNRPCDLAASMSKAMGLAYDIPVFTLSVGFDCNDEAALRMLADDLGSLIEFVEKKFPGKKYDEDKLIEQFKIREEALKISIQRYEMLKHVPCLVDPREAFGGGGNASPLHPEKSLAYARAKLEELRERAARGFSALPEEKLRTIWTVTGYNNDRAPLDYLASRGVALLMRTDDGIIKGCGFLPTYGDESQFGRKLSPLEEQARELLNGFWLALKEQWVVAITRLITELKCDFLINFVQSGCTQTIGLARIVEETVQKELGTPSLHVEGRSLFSEGYNREAVLRQFGDFIDMMLAKKGLHN